MGYYSRFTLHAVDPMTRQEVPLGTLPSHYFVRVQDALEEAYGSDVPVNLKGDLFRGESAKFYEHPGCLQKLSAACPELVWVIHGLGEDSKEWAVYAYRGKTYTIEAPPWVPDPPDFSRLPEPMKVRIEPDPPTPAEALKQALDQGSHGVGCAVHDFRPCDCWMSKAQAALKAMEAGERKSLTL